MTVTVEYDKKRDKLIVESDGPGGPTVHRAVQGDFPLRALFKYNNLGKVEAANPIVLNYEIRKKYREKTGFNCISV